VDRLSDIKRRFPHWLSLFAGGISATGFAPLNFWPVTLLALALWMAIVADRENWKQAALSGWLFGIGHFVVGLNWIAKAFTFQAAMPEWLGYIAVVLLAFYLAVYPALAALGAWVLGKDKSLGFVIAIAGFWVISEWLRSWVFSGFIWNPLGSVLTPTLLTQYATWIGTYGLSGLAIGLSGVVLLVFQKRNLVTFAWPKSGTWIGIIFFVIFLAPVVVAMLFPSVLGSIESKLNDNASSITIVQPNIGQQDKWKAGYEEQNLAKLAELTERENEEPRILFWPEAAIPDYLEAGYPRRYYYGRPPELVRAQLASLMQPGDVLVLGALKLEFEEAGERAVGARNSVFAMDSDRELLGRYDKAHLVPYGEYLPMRPVLEAIGLSRLAPGDFDFWPGPGPRSLDLGVFGKTGLQICYEIIFSGQVVDRDNRPDFIFNPSNDAWFGTWGPPQHLAQARLRAIEEGLPVIRSTPTGISAVIDANGVVKESIAMGVAGRIDTTLPIAKSPTLFAIHGNILPLGFAFILLISAIAIRLRGG
jgi:apolipoprotein N-acyltransferase